MSNREHAGRLGWLLALHSSGDSLGVALQPLGQATAPPRTVVVPAGRELSNSLLPAVEALLPAREWRDLARLAVATGPGGFTGTRLTVALARTLAQQLHLPLDGISSFHLIARRSLMERPSPNPVILRTALPRHGWVAGLYCADPASLGGVAELGAPRLYRDDATLAEALGPHGHRDAQPQLPADVETLLAFSQEASQRGWRAPWPAVVPLYPTSPVERP
ncbi:MAG: tRNA (adenosine(37)-N6)-threonylcarbamoyltransferase complex dimerization subunit type 1 TsaB [Cyanobacteriota bacterium]|jgi:tRNA threonylcarbamoyladenosine biosynthesis protein TsaB